MLYLRVMGFRTSSEDGIFTFSLQDGFGRWGEYQQEAREIGITKSIEMNDRPALLRALRLLEKAVRERKVILREAASAPFLSRVEVLGLERQRQWQRPQR